MPTAIPCRGVNALLGQMASLCHAPTGTGREAIDPPDPKANAGTDPPDSTAIDRQGHKGIDRQGLTVIGLRALKGTDHPDPMAIDLRATEAAGQISAKAADMAADSDMVVEAADPISVKAVDVKADMAAVFAIRYPLWVAAKPLVLLAKAVKTTKHHQTNKDAGKNWNRASAATDATTPVQPTAKRILQIFALVLVWYRKALSRV